VEIIIGQILLISLPQTHTPDTTRTLIIILKNNTIQCNLSDTEIFECPCFINLFDLIFLLLIKLLNKFSVRMLQTTNSMQLQHGNNIGDTR
jgi:hypothetical protein